MAWNAAAVALPHPNDKGKHACAHAETTYDMGTTTEAHR